MMVGMRKKYDQVKEATKKIEQRIERLRKERENLNAEKVKI